MKNNKATRLIQILFILPLLFIGQSECRAIEQSGCQELPLIYNQAIIDSIIDVIRQRIIGSSLRKGYSPQSVKDVIYVTQLSFIDAKTRTIATNLHIELFNQFVSEIIEQFGKKIFPLKLNAPDHLIKDTAENVNKLIELLFDPRLIPTERVTKIINEMMNPAQVDVIVAGQFVDEQEKINIKPLIIVKKNQKIVAKSLTFLKADYICSNPADPPKNALCSYVCEEGWRAVKELLEQL